MGLFDTVKVESLNADFQTKQLGKRSLRYRITPNGFLLAPGNATVPYHGILHLVGERKPNYMAVFTHGHLEVLQPLTGRQAGAYRCIGRGLVWLRKSW
jgi:hypothetical protein